MKNENGRERRVFFPTCFKVKDRKSKRSILAAEAGTILFFFLLDFPDSKPREFVPLGFGIEKQKSRVLYYILLLCALYFAACFYGK